MAMTCTPPGARWAAFGGVFVTTGIPRKRMASGCTAREIMLPADR